MEIIPAMDIIDGKCVRLSQGDYAQKKVYSSNPLEIAKSFEQSGVVNLHLVDLDGAKAKSPQNLKTVEQIAKHTNLHIDFGGGLKSEQSIRNAFSAGVDKVNIGTAAIEMPLEFEQWIHLFGVDNIILSADVRDEKVAVGGWLHQSNLSIFDFLQKEEALGLKYVTVTDIQKDGMLQGATLSLYRKLINAFPELHFIASGGFAEIKELDKLKKAGCFGVIIGKAIYENKIQVKDLIDWQKNA
jgi:phosphoribosylformimino-5-aminoimidazole carboxamide ribotide isomerase